MAKISSLEKFRPPWIPKSHSHKTQNIIIKFQNKTNTKFSSNMQCSPLLQAWQENKYFQTISLDQSFHLLNLQEFQAILGDNKKY